MGELTYSDPTASERDVQLYYLNKVRRAVVRTTECLTDEQLRSPGVASGTSLLWLLQHLAAVERHWFRRVFLGEDITPDYRRPVPAGTTYAEVRADYERACAESDEIIRRHEDLSAMARVPNPGEDQLDTLRVIVAHLIEETARHAGHADILRERIDGTTGL
ncbi:MAG TPA: DinB family protein [Pseudonocardiaceae bacterium]